MMTSCWPLNNSRQMRGKPRHVSERVDTSGAKGLTPVQIMVVFSGFSALQKWNCPISANVPAARHLGDSRISEAPSGDHGMEFFETVFECDWPRQLGGRVAVPAAELGDDPTGPPEYANACTRDGRDFKAEKEAATDSPPPSVVATCRCGGGLAHKDEYIVAVLAGERAHQVLIGKIRHRGRQVVCIFRLESQIVERSQFRIAWRRACALHP